MAWYHDDKGHVSSMRIISVPGAYVGMSGLVASVVAMFMKNPAAVGMAGVCIGVVTTAMGLKWAQKVQEAKQ